MADAGEGAAGAHAHHHRIQLVLHLLPDLGAGGGLVGLDVVGIAELVDEEGALLLGHALGHVLVILRMALGHVGAGQHHLRAHGAQVEYLLLAHLVGDHQDQAVTLLGRHQRQPQAGVAGSGLHDGGAGLQITALLRFLDHAAADAVLDGAARVHEFELEEQPAGAGVEMGQLQHRRLADHLEHVGIDAHAVSGRYGGEGAILRECLQ